MSEVRLDPINVLIMTICLETSLKDAACTLLVRSFPFNHEFLVGFASDVLDSLSKMFPSRTVMSNNNVSGLPPARK